MSSVDVLSIKQLSELLSPSVHNPHRPVFSTALLLAVDNLVLWLVLRTFLGHQVILVQDGAGAAGALWPLLVLFQVFYWVCNIYPGISVSPVDDLRRLAAANSGAFFLISLMLALRGAPLHVHLQNVAACIIASAAMPAIRTVMRRAAGFSCGAIRSPLSAMERRPLRYYVNSRSSRIWGCAPSHWLVTVFPHDKWKV